MSTVWFLVIFGTGVIPQVSFENCVDNANNINVNVNLPNSRAICIPGR